jgi:glycerol-3-phosphate dehydrogenase
MLDRSAAWDRLSNAEFDVLVIGGGVTGAGVLYEAARRGLRAALVERNDFASGTSSRSSKLIHGGLRYLKEGKIGVTLESVRERQALLRDAPDLVRPLEFVVPHYRRRPPGRAPVALGLLLYDALAGTRQHRYADRDETLRMVPPLDPRGLTGAHLYLDATTDDARLVCALLAAACDEGALALNYAQAHVLVENDRVCGARVSDRTGDATAQVRARAVINATGVFADELRAGIGERPRLRPLRGSHLVVADWRLPLAYAVAFQHPHDGRPLFAYPWMGRTLVGTTDLDHAAPLDREPSIAPSEVEYLLAAVRHQFPAASLEAGDVIATFAGIRSIVDTRAAAPSAASRDHAVWNERGLITITGGKLTAFRPMAMEALAAAAPQLPPFDRRPRRVVLGSPASSQLAAAPAADSIGDTPFAWSDLRRAARCEMVVHLDDLLLRRTRVGLLLRDGGARFFDEIAAICRHELHWDHERWRRERSAYEALWREHHSL